MAEITTEWVLDAAASVVREWQQSTPPWWDGHMNVELAVGDLAEALADDGRQVRGGVS